MPAAARYAQYKASLVLENSEYGEICYENDLQLESLLRRTLLSLACEHLTRLDNAKLLNFN